MQIDMAAVAIPVFAVDFRDPPAPDQAIAAAVGLFNRPDLLAIGAGASRPADFFTSTDQDWDQKD